MKHEFTLVHVGFNKETAKEARELATLLSTLFNLPLKTGEKSDFAGEIFEFMHAPYYGKNGHIALQTEDLPGALEELAEKGLTTIPESRTYFEDGRLKNIYLSEDFGGFAIHILQKP